jgi:general stress protein YciG
VLQRGTAFPFFGSGASRRDDETGRHEFDLVPETPPDEPGPAPVKKLLPGELEPCAAGSQWTDHTDPGISRSQSGLTAGGGALVNGERKERRGFASMSPEKQREIASKGGRAAHQKGTAHEWTSDEARQAGRKGGQVSRGGRGRLVLPSDEGAYSQASGTDVPVPAATPGPARVDVGRSE